MRALRILLAEDDVMIGMLLAEMLVGMGYDVCAIEPTEADAVAAAARCRPDLIIVDARLGEGSGVSAVEQTLRAGFVPQVFVSGDTARVRALRPGAVLLQKPFREPDLAGAIQRALSAAAASCGGNRSRDLSQNLYARRSLPHSSPLFFNGIKNICNPACIARLRRRRFVLNCRCE